MRCRNTTRESEETQGWQQWSGHHSELREMRGGRCYWSPEQKEEWRTGSLDRNSNLGPTQSDLAGRELGA